jgi:hypothetical protein
MFNVDPSIWGSGSGRGVYTAAPPTGQPGAGSDIYGRRVGAIPTPPVPTGANLSAVYPNLSGTNASASSALLNELRGQLSPETLANIQNAAAQYGVTSGMPGSGLSINRGLRDIGLTTEQLQHQGIGDYSSLIPTVSATQTVTPEQQAQLQSHANDLGTEVAAFNATNAAAPDPAAAGSYAQQLFKQYLDKLSGPAGGSGQQWWAQTSTASGPGWGSGMGSNVGTPDWVFDPRYS